MNGIKKQLSALSKTLTNLVSFLNGLNDFFIEVEGKPDKLQAFIAEYNSKANALITMTTDGIRVLGADVDKWALEFRLYTNQLPQAPLGDSFCKNNLYRPEYKYRLNNNKLIRKLLYSGFNLGRN